jgi:hypothetical protein
MTNNMKKIYILLVASIISLNIFAQSTLNSAIRYNFYDDLVFNPPVGTQAEAGPDYGCLAGHTNRPIWFYINVCGADSLIDNSSVVIFASGGTAISLILWGPFDDTINIASKLISSNIDTCRLHVIPNSNTVFPRFQHPKFYYGMISMDDNVNFHRMITGGFGPGGCWVDDRCGISNSRVANYKQDICMVTVDSTTQKNMIIWDKRYNFQTASFNIYREGSVTGQFDSIGNVPVTSNSFFIDNAVDPTLHSYRYRMTAVDSTGQTEYDYSPYDSAHVHTTIHLLASPGLSNDVNLSWNAYVGFPYSTFYIYRGSSSNSLQILDSVSSGTFAYTDNNPQPGLDYYKVLVKNSNGCSPDGGTTHYSVTRSNDAYLNNVGVNEVNNSIQLIVSPNPSFDDIHLLSSRNINNGVLKIYNVLGENIYSNSINGNQMTINCRMEKGVYIIQVSESKKIWTQKFIRN